MEKLSERMSSEVYVTKNNPLESSECYFEVTLLSEMWGMATCLKIVVIF